MAKVPKWETCYQLGKCGNYCFAKLVYVEYVIIQMKMVIQKLKYQKESEKKLDIMIPYVLKRKTFSFTTNIEVQLWGRIMIQE